MVSEETRCVYDPCAIEWYRASFESSREYGTVLVKLGRKARRGRLCHQGDLAETKNR